jgi:2-amino-4-hydroxy-6-hydroxymethyldihydropteridine diphosphokinase
MVLGSEERIFIGLGSNLPGPHGDPRAQLEAALRALTAQGLRVVRRSRWYETEPVPVSDQPWFVNGVIEVETGLGPTELLALLHRVEAAFGRIRRVRNEARALDLDLLAYGERVMAGEDQPELPHPRLQDRAFVLLPLAEIAPAWRHPVLGETAAALAGKLPPGQRIRLASQGTEPA